MLRRARRVLVLLSALVFAPGCGGSPPRETASPSAAPASVPSAQTASTASTVVHRTTLRFELGENAFPLPLVDVLVNGQPTTLIVDTGATHAVVGDWIPEELGLVPSKADSQGLDHTGKAVELARLEGVALSLPGFGPRTTDLLVTRLPAPMRRIGLGGVLSPQAFAADGRAIVLDLAREELSELASADASRSVDDSAADTVHGELRACGAHGATLPFVPVVLNGVKVMAQLDTGATSTSVRAASAAGVVLAPLVTRSRESLVASGTTSLDTVDGASLTLGGSTVEVSVDLVARETDDACPTDALLGMDVLKRCTWVFDGDRVTGRCDAR
ncbi:MAG: retropepsin-like aspartic protease [Polyangiaceae bacterium]